MFLRSSRVDAVVVRAPGLAPDRPARPAEPGSGGAVGDVQREAHFRQARAGRRDGAESPGHIPVNLGEVIAEYLAELLRVKPGPGDAAGGPGLPAGRPEHRLREVESLRQIAAAHSTVFSICAPSGRSEWSTVFARCRTFLSRPASARLPTGTRPAVVPGDGELAVPGVVAGDGPGGARDEAAVRVAGVHAGDAAAGLAGHRMSLSAGLRWVVRGGLARGPTGPARSRRRSAPP